MNPMHREQLRDSSREQLMHRGTSVFRPSVQPVSRIGPSTKDASRPRARLNAVSWQSHTGIVDVEDGRRRG